VVGEFFASALLYVEKSTHLRKLILKLFIIKKFFSSLNSVNFEKNKECKRKGEKKPKNLFLSGDLNL
jgi:hypothetical protein